MYISSLGFQALSGPLTFENWTNKLCRNVDKLLSTYATQHPRRGKASHSFTVNINKTIYYEYYSLEFQTVSGPLTFENGTNELCRNVDNLL